MFTLRNMLPLYVKKNSWFRWIDNRHWRWTKKRKPALRKIDWDSMFWPDAADRGPILFCTSQSADVVRQQTTNIGQHSGSLWRLCGIWGRSKFRKKWKENMNKNFFLSRQIFYLSHLCRLALTMEQKKWGRGEIGESTLVSWGTCLLLKVRISPKKLKLKSQKKKRLNIET